MKPLEYKDGVLKLIDQTRLPVEKIIVDCKTYEEVANAIVDMIRSCYWHHGYRNQFKG